MAFRKGSDGAADEKQNKLMLVLAAIATIVVWCCLFVFDTDLKAFSDRASKFANILGSVFLFGSWFWLLIGHFQKWDAKAGLGWLLLFAAGILTSCGFNFDYFGL